MVLFQVTVGVFNKIQIYSSMFHIQVETSILNQFQFLHYLFTEFRINFLQG